MNVWQFQRHVITGDFPNDPIEEDEEEDELIVSPVASRRKFNTQQRRQQPPESPPNSRSGKMAASLRALNIDDEGEDAEDERDEYWEESSEDEDEREEEGQGQEASDNQGLDQLSAFDLSEILDVEAVGDETVEDTDESSDLEDEEETDAVVEEDSIYDVGAESGGDSDGSTPNKSTRKKIVVKDEQTVNVFLLAFLSAITSSIVPFHTRWVAERNKLVYERGGSTYNAITDGYLRDKYY